MMQNFLDPKTDVVFKHLFGREKNKELLINFINDALNLSGNKIVDIDFQKTEFIGFGDNAKKIILDVHCLDNFNRHHIVEMQLGDVTNFAKRAQYYVSTVYSEQLKDGEDYTELKPVYLIAILNKPLFTGVTNYISHHSILEESTYKSYLNDMKFVFI